MPKISTYPSMIALGGSELLLGDQGGVTKTGTPAQIAAYLNLPATYVQRANNLSDLANAATARTNLGLTQSWFNGLLTVARPIFDGNLYNIVADGVTNNDAAIQAVLADIAAEGGGTLQLPGGTASINFATTISMPANCVIQGVGRAATNLKYTGAAAAVYFVGGVSARSALADLTLTGSGTGYGIQIGDTNFAGDTNFDRMYVTGFSNGVRLAAALWATFNSIYFTGNAVSDVDFNAGSNSVYSTTVTFNQCQFVSSVKCVTASYVPITNQGCAWYGCTFQASGTPQFQLTDGSGGMTGLVIDGGYAEGTATQDLFNMAICGPFRIANVYVNGCNRFAYDGIGGASGAGFMFCNLVNNFGAALSPIIFASDPGIIEAMNQFAAGSPAITGTGSVSLSGQGIASWPIIHNSWTPVLNASSGGPPTYTTQSAIVDQVGKKVSFSLEIAVSSLGTLSGSINISGLPVAAQNNVAGLQWSFDAYCTGITPVGSNNVFKAILAAGGTSLTLVAAGTVTPAAVQASACAAGTTITVSGTYSTN
jgi:hypothetical protein